MATSSLSFFAKAIAGMVVFFAILVVVGSIVIHYYPSALGYYSYSVEINGLSDYQGAPVTQIVVPIPSLGGVSVFPDERLQHRAYGNWTSLLVVTEHGKMLAFQSFDTNFTDIDAHFSKEIHEYPAVDEINGDIFVPTGRSLLRTENTTDNYAYIIIPDALRPLSDTSGPITAYINLTIHGGTTLGEPHLDREYQVSIVKEISPGTTGIIPVEPQVYYRKSPAESFSLLEENTSMN